MDIHFGTNGIRGKIDQFNPELAAKIAEAAVYYLKGKRIVVGRDGRVTSELLSRAVCCGVQRTGATAIDVGLAPTPCVEHFLTKINADGAMIVTASHNPPEWNGLKVVDGDCIAISKERGAEIENIVNKGLKTKIGKVITYKNCTEDYIRKVLTYVKERVNKKVVLDCGNGTASLVAPKLFKHIGVDVISINSHIDGRFPGRPSEPLKENVKELIDVVRDSGADCGIGWDGDGDRVVFVDEKGEYVIGDRVFALSVMIKLKERLGSVVTTVATTRAIKDVTDKFGVKLYYSKVGAPYISEEMKKRNAVIGGEEVGGVVWPEVSLGKDGLFTALKIITNIKEKTLSEWMEEFPTYINKKERIPMNKERGKRILEKMREYAKQKRWSINTIDGVRIDFEDCWVIIRVSGTEECIRIFCEAKEAENVDRTMERIKDVITKLGESV